MKKIRLFLSAFAMMVSLVSCKNEEGDRDVAFQFEYRVNVEPFTHNQVYDIGGTAVSFKFAQFYAGGAQ